MKDFKIFQTMNQITIGCDIGGVVRDPITNLQIDDSLESINRLIEDNYKIIFISKCKALYEERSKMWLENNKLSHLEAFFCINYNEKLAIALRQKVSIIIDDRIQVLATFRNNHDLLKVWFCNDDQKINGTKKYQPDLYQTMRLARNWPEVVNIINAFRDSQ